MFWGGRTTQNVLSQANQVYGFLEYNLTLCLYLCLTLHILFGWFLLSPTGLETQGRQKESESASHLVVPDSLRPHGL